MQLGFVSAILPELNLDQILAFAAAERFTCVEPMCWPVRKAERKYAGVTHVDVDGLTKGRAEETRALCARHRVGLSALGYYPNPLDPDPAVAKVRGEPSAQVPFRFKHEDSIHDPAVQRDREGRLGGRLSDGQKHRDRLASGCGRRSRSQPVASHDLADPREVGWPTAGIGEHSGDLAEVVATR